MKSWLSALFVMTAIQQTSTASVWNPYTPPRTKLDALIIDAASGGQDSDRALEAWLRAHPNGDLDRRRQAYQQLCTNYMVRSEYKLLAHACAEGEKLERAAGGSPTGQAGALAAAFANEPSARSFGSAKVPLKWNPLGSQDIEVMVNGVTSSVIVDTGAQITVLPQSVASRMNVRLLPRDTNISTTTSEVRGQLGMIDRLWVGSAHVDSVPVLVLPDSQLAGDGAHHIDGILGLQVFYAFGRMAWLDDGKVLALGNHAPRARASSPRLYWHGEGLGVPVRANGKTKGAFLDTAANVSELRIAGIEMLSPDQVSAEQERSRHVGGVGGIVELKQRFLPNFALYLGPVCVRLSAVGISADNKPGAAKIGMDAVEKFHTLLFDLRRMHIDGTAKTSAKTRCLNARAVSHLGRRLTSAEPQAH